MSDTPADALREQIAKILYPDSNFPIEVLNKSNSNGPINLLLDLIAQDKAKLLQGLMDEQAYHRCEGGWFEYVPAEVITAYQPQVGKDTV